MGWQTLGSEVREFIRGLFGSRLNAHLEEELLRTRADYEVRLQEYVEQQAVLREQIAQQSAKIEKYEMVLLPMVYGNIMKPKGPPVFSEMVEDPDNWAAIQKRWEQEQSKPDEPEPKQ